MILKTERGECPLSPEGGKIATLRFVILSNVILSEVEGQSKNQCDKKQRANRQKRIAKSHIQTNFFKKLACFWASFFSIQF
jgi:hypothetical protein